MTTTSAVTAVPCSGKMLRPGDFVVDHDGETAGEVEKITPDGILRARRADGSTFTRRAAHVTALIASTSDSTISIKPPFAVPGEEIVGMIAHAAPVVARNGEQLTRVEAWLTAAAERRARTRCALDRSWTRTGERSFARHLTAGAYAEIDGPVLAISVPDMSEESIRAALGESGIIKADEVAVLERELLEVPREVVEEGLHVSLAADGSPLALYKLDDRYFTVVRENNSWRRLTDKDDVFGHQDIAVTAAAVQAWDVLDRLAAARSVAPNDDLSDFERVYVAVDDAEKVVGIYGDRSRGRTYLRKDGDWTPADPNLALMEIDVEISAVRAWDDGALATLTQVTPFDVHGDAS